ncbi:hypothetical protein PVV24_23525, partial [Salmonella enterica subsp. enterica serovar Mbandaka]
PGVCGIGRASIGVAPPGEGGVLPSYRTESGTITALARRRMLAHKFFRARRGLICRVNSSGKIGESAP